MNIPISISEKIPTVHGDPVIVCDNTDYSVVFTFDDEWQNQPVKTARFSYINQGKKMFVDVVLTGNTVAMPPLINTNEVQIGVYASGVCTTAPAVIPCRKSILSLTGDHAEPSDDIYNELLLTINEKMVEALNNAISEGEISIDDVKNIVEYNKRERLTFWVGTQAEYDALATKTPNRFYLVTDAEDASELLSLPDKVAAVERDVAALKNRKSGEVLFDGIISAGETVSETVPGLSQYNIILVYLTRDDLPLAERGVLCAKSISEDGTTLAFEGVSHHIPATKSGPSAFVHDAVTVKFTGDVITRVNFESAETGYPTQCVTKIIGIA